MSRLLVGKRFALVLTIWLVWTASAFAQPDSPPVFLRSSVEAHLRQSGVDALFEDRDGFLWIGTREGLVRWDGHESRHWSSLPFDTTSLPHNVVTHIDQDGDGHLWIITRPHIFGSTLPSRLLAPDFETIRTYRQVDVAVAIDGEGQPWLVSNDTILRYLPAEDHFVAWMERPNPPTDLPHATFDGEGYLWIVQEAGIERCHLASKTCRAVQSRPGVVHQKNVILLDGRILHPAPEGLDCFDGAHRFLPCEDLGPLPNTLVTQAERDPLGDLWLATFEGVWKTSTRHPEPERIEWRANGAGDDVYAFLLDRSGGAWAGTPWGLLQFAPYRHPFRHMPLGGQLATGHASTPVLSLHVDPEGRLWAGTIGGGLYVRHGDGSWQHYPETLWAMTPSHETSFVWSMASLGENLWLATTYGLIRLHRKTGEISHKPLPASLGADSKTPRIRKVIARPPDELWVMTYHDGLLRLVGDRFEKIYGAPDASFVEDMTFESNGRIWLATTEDGLKRVDPASGKAESFRHDPADPSSLGGQGGVALLVDGQGTLWVGTTSGLDRLLDDGRHFAHVLGPEDLPSSTVLSILEGPRRLWLSTNRGLVSVDKEIARRHRGPGTLPEGALTVWTRQEGVENLEFNRGANYRDDAGRFYFGGDRGITHFLPETIVPSTYRPPLRLDTLTLFDYRGRRQVRPLPGEEVEIGPRVTSFTVELATIDFTAQPGNLFALRLVGVDPDWIDLGSRRSVTYAGVSPGRYVLQGRVSNADGIWNTETLEVQLNVIPPFYRTLWFYAVVVASLAMALLGLGVLLTRHRYRRQLRQLQIENQRAEDRRRISRDLHDELGAGLTHIVLTSERGIRQPERGSETLQRVADGARQLIDGIREIIWSIDPEQDRLDRLSTRLRGTVAEMLEAAEIRADLDFPDNPAKRAVSPQLRRNVSLMVREAVHNAVRHAQARRVSVQMRHREGEITLHIVDDGRGFDPNAVHDGQGLRNLRTRAQAVGGQTVIDSRPGEGTRVTIQVPLSS